MRETIAKETQGNDMIYRSIEVDNATLHVMLGGNLDSNNTCMLIQGLGCEAETIWPSMIAELQQIHDGYQYIAFDGRGIGQSSGWPKSLQELADDAAAVLEHEGCGPAHIVGHSLGGVVAMILAAQYPEKIKSLTLMNTVPQYSEKTRSGFMWRAEQVRTTGSVSTIFETVIPRSFGSQAQTNNARMIQAFQGMLSRQSPTAYAQLCELAAANDSWDVFRRIDKPILFMSGAEDATTSSAVMQPLANYKGGDFVEILDAGHNPPLEQPARVASVLCDWLRAYEN